MKRISIFFAISVLAVLGITHVQAQGNLTLESLAASIESLINKDDELESRIVALENQLGLVTVTHTVTSTPTYTPTSTNTPTVTLTPIPTYTPTITPTPSPTFTPSPTLTPTPLPPSTAFEEVRSAYTGDRDAFKRRYTGKNIYVKGRISRLTERSPGWHIEFRDGSLLDVTCHVPTSRRSQIRGLRVGNVVIVYGRARLDLNVFSDDDLLIENCGVVLASEEEQRAQSSRATPTPQPSQATFIVDSENVNVRAGPGVNHEVIGVVKKGQSFIITGTNEQGDWLRFQFEGKEGWAAAYLMDVKNGDEAPVVEITTPISSPTPESDCDGEFELIDIEDVSYSNIVRASVRIEMTLGCDEDHAMLFAFLYSEETKSEIDINAVNLFFYCDYDSSGGYANASIVFAPYGDWSRAGEVRAGNYSKHELSLEFARELPCK